MFLLTVQNSRRGSCACGACVLVFALNFFLFYFFSRQYILVREHVIGSTTNNIPFANFHISLSFSLLFVDNYVTKKIKIKIFLIDNAMTTTVL